MGDEDEYTVGSIVRIRMHNFLTYADAEVRPGARLNVIVGPNGSGKSTILCAIALGLGSNAGALERGDGVGGYVMRDKEKGYVEIELKGERGNTIIRRDFERASNKSSYKVNGKNVTQQAALETVKRLNIQVNNLCTFLPQEKVGKFTEMDAQKLLQETMLALSSSNLTEDHQKLIDMQKRMKTAGRERETVAKSLENLEEANRQLEQDKERMEKRQEYEKEANLLEKCLRWKEFTTLQEEARELKSQRADLEKELKKANDEVAPYKKKVDRLKEKERDAQEGGKQADANFKKARKACEIANEAVETQSDAVLREAAKVEEFEYERAREVKRRDQTKKEYLEAVKERDNFDPEKTKDDIAALNARHRQLRKVQDEKTRLVQSEEREVNDLNADVEDLKRGLAELQNEGNQRLEAFQRSGLPYARDAVEVYHWIQKNREKFEGRVFGPLALEVSVDDPVTAAMVEAQIPNFMLVCFVVENGNDKELLLQTFTRGQRKKKITVQQLQEGWQNFQRTEYYSEQDMQEYKKYGISGLMKDKITAKPQVLATLMNMANIHRVLIGDSRTEDAVSKHNLIERLTAAGGGGDGGGEGTAAVVFTQKGDNITQHRGTKSRYAPYRVTIGSKGIPPARVLGGGQVDGAAARIRQVQQNLREAEAKFAQKVSALKLLKEEANTIIRETSKIQKEESRLKANLKDINLLKKRVERLKIKLDEAEREVAKDTESELRRIKARVQKFTTVYVDAVISNSDTVESFLEAWSNKIPPKVTHTVAGILTKAAEDVYNTKAEEQTELRNSFEQKNKEYRKKIEELKPKKQSLDAEIPISGPNADQELVTAMDTRMVDVTVQECRNQYLTAKSAAEAIVDNPQVLREYAKRKREMEAKRKELEELTNQCEHGQDALDNVAKPWKSKLEKLTHKLHIKFGAYMKQMDCAGEVRLVEDENDYSAWGLQLMVKFRKEMELGALSAKVQSGGERSVSTILFLMALQEMMDSPFRAVDEINQGMDERNERLIFSRIVANSTKVQYFLVTPKLLPGLTAMEMDHVTVLFVFNAPDLLRYDQWSIPKFIEAAKNRKRGGSSSGATGGGGGGGGPSKRQRQSG